MPETYTSYIMSVLLSFYPVAEMLAHIAKSVFNKLYLTDMADWPIANMYGGFKRRKISRVN